MKPALLLAVIAALALAGCAAPANDLPPMTTSVPTGAAVAPVTLTSLRACTAHNVFLQTTQESLAPHVPSNWTFTGAGAPHGILRMFRVECEDGRALLMLSTPMVPDAASLEHHDNPDVVIDVFTNDEDTLPHWEATGARATLAEFTTAPFPGGVSLITQAEDGLVLGLDLVAQPAAQPGQPYEWQAVYAAGTDAIGWLWGDEVAGTTLQHQYAVHLGPGTRVDAADAQPIAMGSEWIGFDVGYQHGLPEAEAEG